MTSQFISYFSRRCDSLLFQLKKYKEEDGPMRRSLRWAVATQAAAEGGKPATSTGDQSKPRGGEQVETRAMVEAGKGLGAKEEGCTFCEIVAWEQDAYRVYEDEHCVAFLDILPVRPGHLLVIPKKHYARVSHLPDEVSASIGRVLPRISRALCAAMNQPDFNIVSNQGYAQIVHHVHFHLVPAPTSDSPIRSGWAAIIGRDELDDDEAVEIAQSIRDQLKVEEAKSRKAKL